MKDLLEDLRGYSGARVRYGNHDIMARRHLRILRLIHVIEVGRLGLDRQKPAIRHGIAGVDREVEYRRLELGRIDDRLGLALHDVDLEADIFADTARRERRHAFDEVIDRDLLRLERLAARKGQKLLRQSRSL